MLLEIDHVTKSFGGVVATNDVSVSVKEGKMPIKPAASSSSLIAISARPKNVRGILYTMKKISTVTARMI